MRRQINPYTIIASCATLCGSRSLATTAARVTNDGRRCQAPVPSPSRRRPVVFPADIQLDGARACRRGPCRCPRSTVLGWAQVTTSLTGIYLHLGAREANTEAGHNVNLSELRPVVSVYSVTHSSSVLCRQPPSLPITKQENRPRERFCICIVPTLHVVALNTTDSTRQNSVGSFSWVTDNRCSRW